MHKTVETRQWHSHKFFWYLRENQDTNWVDIDNSSICYKVKATFKNKEYIFIRYMHPLSTWELQK